MGSSWSSLEAYVIEHDEDQAVAEFPAVGFISLIGGLKVGKHKEQIIGKQPACTTGQCGLQIRILTNKRDPHPIRSFKLSSAGTGSPSQ